MLAARLAGSARLDHLYLWCYMRASDEDGSGLLSRTEATEHAQRAFGLSQRRAETIIKSEKILWSACGRYIRLSSIKYLNSKYKILFYSKRKVYINAKLAASLSDRYECRKAMTLALVYANFFIPKKMLSRINRTTLRNHLRHWGCFPPSPQKCKEVLNAGGSRSYLD